MTELSVVISAYNEEKNIADCLSSVSSADEIILVDNASTDKTVQLARKFTNKIFVRPNHPMLNINKNYGFSKATSEWILSLDADERATEELKDEIQSTIHNPQSTINGFWIRRKNIIFGKWIRHGIWWPDYQLRLFKKDKGKFPCKHVHEYLKVRGKTKKLKNPLIHYNYTTISQFIDKMDKIYTENEVDNILSHKKELQWYDALRMPTGDFLKTFFLQKGHKDGLHGLVLSLMLSFYQLVVFAKVWEKRGFKEYNRVDFLNEFQNEFKKAVKDFKFWFFKSEEDSSINPLVRLIKKVNHKMTRWF